MRKFAEFLYRLLTEEAGEVAVTADPAPSPAPAADPAPDPTLASSPDPAPDPLSDLPSEIPSVDDFLKATLGDDPAPDLAQQPADIQIPEQFKAALEISPFVTNPEQVSQAIQAADEVWKVATGQLPARQMLEGFKTSNPQMFERVANDLREYLGVGTQQANPLEALKAANPDVYNAVADYIQKQTGKPIDGPADPREQRLQALEARYAQEEHARQQDAVQHQQRVADEAAHSFLNDKLKGTFAEGENDYFIGEIARKLGPKGIQQSMQEVLSGNTKTLEKAYREVMKDTITRVKSFSDKMVATYKKQKNMVPASKGTQVTRQDPNAPPARKPGESDMDYSKRVWDSGYTA